MWRSEPDGHKMKVAAWSCFAKMDICEAKKMPQATAAWRNLADDSYSKVTVR